MTRIGRLANIAAAVLTLIPVGPGQIRAQQPPAPEVRAIPGITAPDSFPQGCVSCHIVLPDGTDVRLSTLMRRLVAGADSAQLAKAQAAAPAGLTLKGKHPDASRALANVPAGCLTCHGETATIAPPFARLLHLIHLTGGEANHFLSMFQGQCTYCHKLDAATGAWSLPSGPER
jgi:hypothetical protein